MKGEGGGGYRRCEDKLKETLLLKFEWLDGVVHAMRIRPRKDYFNKDVSEIVDDFLL